jgi:uncharacterized protein with HEPN domain
VRGDRARLADILERIDKILAHAPPKAPAGSDASWTLDAVVRNLEVIGEAARQLSPGIRRKNPSIPWRAMIGFRVLATHVYWEVEPERVWVIVRELAELRRKLARIHALD